MAGTPHSHRDSPSELCSEPQQLRNSSGPDLGSGPESDPVRSAEGKIIREVRNLKDEITHLFPFGLSSLEPLDCHTLGLHVDARDHC